MRFFHRLKAYFTPKSLELKRFEKRIQYQFVSTYYLEKALTHRSIKNYYEGNYERLEFLGDAIIDHVVSHWLFIKYVKSDEGTLTKKRAALVNREFLAMLGKNLQVTEVVQIDAGVNIKDEKVANNISADIYEALVGAIYLDGGYEDAADFIKRTLFPAEHLSKEDANYKGQLIEFCHSHSFPTPQFEIVESHGPEHERIFTVKVSIDNQENWLGMGSTKKSAEQDCAKQALEYLMRS